jgi:hypothetical protein
MAMDDQQKSGAPYKLYSIGPDGQAETDDDIKLTTESDGPTDLTTSSTTTQP